MKHNGTWKLGLCLLSVLLLALFAGAALAENNVTLTVNGGTTATVALDGDALTFAAAAPGADHIALWSNEDIMEGPHDGAGASDTWELGPWEPGTYSVFAVATYPDEHSEVSAPVSVTIESSGYLERPAIEMPGRVSPGEDYVVQYEAVEYDETLGGPISYFLYVWDPVAEENIFEETHYDTSDFVVPAEDLVAGRIYYVGWNAHVENSSYRYVDMNGTFIVADWNYLQDERAWLTVGDGNDPVHSDGDVYVEIYAPGMTAARVVEAGNVKDVFNFWGEWPEWQENGRVAYHTGWSTDAAPWWGEVSFDQDIDFDDENWQDNVTWVRTNIATVINTVGFRGLLDVPAISLDCGASVERGTPVTLSIDSLDDRAEWWNVSVINGDIVNNDSVYGNDHDNYVIPTVNLQENHIYRVEVNCGAYGYPNRCGQVFFTVTAPQNEDPQISAAPAPLEVNRLANVSAIAPGAEHVAIYEDGNAEPRDSADGDSLILYDVSYDRAGTHTFRLVANYADGTEQVAECELEVTSQGRMPIPVFTQCPEVVHAGEDAFFEWTMPDDFAYDGAWNFRADYVYLNAEDHYEDHLIWADDHLSEPCIAIPAEALEPGKAYYVSVEPWPVIGLEMPIQSAKCSFIVVPEEGADGGIFFDVNGAHYDEEHGIGVTEIALHENLNYYYAAADGATAFRIYDGRENWWYERVDGLDENGASFLQREFMFMDDVVGEVEMFAEYTTDEIPEDPSEDDWDNLNWSAPSYPVRIHIAYDGEYADAPDFIVEFPEITRGDVQMISLQNVAPGEDVYYRANLYYWDDERGWDGSWCAGADWNTMDTIFVSTANVPAGDTLVVVERYERGKFLTDNWAIFQVVDPEPDPETGENIVFRVMPTYVQTNEPEAPRITCYAPGAESIDIVLEEDGDTRTSWGETAVEHWSFCEARDYHFHAVVHYPNGDVITTETQTLTIHAPLGRLDYAVVNGPDVIEAGESYTFDFNRLNVDENVVVFYEYFVEDLNDWHYIPGSGDKKADAVMCRISSAYLVAGHTYRIIMEANALGAESSYYSKAFYVAEPGEQITFVPEETSFWFSIEGDQSAREVPVESPFLMWVSAPGATAFRLDRTDTVEYFEPTGVAPWNSEVSIWERRYALAEPGDYALSMRYTTDPLPENMDDFDWESLTWSERSGIIFLHAVSEGRTNVPSEFYVPEEVVQGRNLAIWVDNPQGGYAPESVNVHVVLEDGNVWLESDRGANDEINIPTAGIAPGTYNVHITACAEGYERSGEVVCQTTVIAPDEDVVIDVSPTNRAVRPGDGVYISVHAAGAEHITLYKAEAGEEEIFWEVDGESLEIWNYVWQEEHDFTFRAVATYADGSTAQSEYASLLIENDGALEPAYAGFPAIVYVGGDGSFDFGGVDEDGAIYAIYVNDRTTGGNEVYSFQSEVMINSIPTNVLQSGHVYDVTVTACAYGMDMSWYNTAFVALDPNAPTFTLPAALTEIDEEAFAGADIVHLIVPDNVRYIWSRAFANCSSLQVVEFQGVLDHCADDAWQGDGYFVEVWPDGSIHDREE